MSHLLGRVITFAAVTVRLCATLVVAAEIEEPHYAKAQHSADDAHRVDVDNVSAMDRAGRGCARAIRRPMERIDRDRCGRLRPRLSLWAGYRQRQDFLPRPVIRYF